MLKPFYQEELIEAGCDEAGRGCLAGPVFAAAVILPKDFHHPLLNDSKQVTEKNRSELRIIIEASAISFGVASIDNDEIDRILPPKVILQSSLATLSQLFKDRNRKPKHTYSLK